jgi:hypothetical protein
MVEENDVVRECLRRERLFGFCLGLAVPGLVVAIERFLNLIAL